MAAELVDVELIIDGGPCGETVTSRVDPHNPADVQGLVKDMAAHFGISGSKGAEYQIKVWRRRTELGTFPVQQQ